MKLSVALLIVLAAISTTPTFAQAPLNEPTEEEITVAYKSKSSGISTIIPGVQWERWRIKEIRGWKLRFRETGQKHSPGLMTLKYEAVAKKGGSCADYYITDTKPIPPANSQMRPIVAVEPNGVRSCF